MRAEGEDYFILCVDDEVGIQSARMDYIELINKANKDISVVAIHPGDIENAPDEEYDLIIIDYRLNKGPSADGETYPYDGDAILGIVKADHPHTPMYLMSNYIDDTEGFNAEAGFENFVNSNWFQNDQIIRSDIDSFRRIYNNIMSKQQVIGDLLCAPEVCQDEVFRIIPDEIVAVSDDDGAERVAVVDIKRKHQNALSQWITMKLLTLPGVLYDSLHMATLLGVKQEYFNDTISVEGDFSSSCKYDGVFSRSVKPLWWKCAAIDYIYSLPLPEEPLPLLINKAAPVLLEVSDDQLSVCDVCDKPHAEIVAHMDGYKDNLHPVHYACSAESNEKTPEPYFDVERVIKEV